MPRAAGASAREGHVSQAVRVKSGRYGPTLRERRAMGRNTFKLAGVGAAAAVLAAFTGDPSEAAIVTGANDYTATSLTNLFQGSTATLEAVTPPASPTPPAPWTARS